MNSEEKERNKLRSNQEAMRSLTMISQFSINMLVPIFLCFLQVTGWIKSLGPVISSLYFSSSELWLVFVIYTYMPRKEASVTGSSKLPIKAIPLEK